MKQPVRERFIRASCRGLNNNEKGSFILHFDSLNQLVDFIYDNCGLYNRRNTLLYLSRHSLLSKKEKQIVARKLVYRRSKDFEY